MEMKKWNKRTFQLVAGTALLAAMAPSAFSAVSAEEAKQLGGSVLTEFGAERAGNKEGTIPEYKNERIKPPANWNPKESNIMPDPFGEKPLFSITEKNMAQYEAKLSEVQKQILKKNPGYRMDIYPTHRTAYYPKYYLDNTVKNATACKTENDDFVLRGCYGGILFPIPKTGRQVIWNHLPRALGPEQTFKNGAVLVTPSGSPVVQGLADASVKIPLQDPKFTQPFEPGAVFYRTLNSTYGPTRKAGEKIILQFALDGITGAKVWQYIPGQRRVKLSPDVAYDTPNPQSGGAATMDQTAVFYGSPDRYDFKLEGKKEMYIMYNNYTSQNAKECPIEKMAQKGFINPDCARWELHRVWVLSATIKPQYRHAMPKRTIYFDEDGWGAGMSDDYDASGKLYRGTFTGYMQVYNDPTNLNWADVSHFYVVDFQTAAWYGANLKNIPDGGYYPTVRRDDSYYSPEALAGQGIR